MDFLLNNDSLANWLIQYGSIALFFLLVAGIIILPVPEETLMVIAGILMRNGSLQIGSTLMAAYFGSICGITISYLIGRTAGHYLIVKYGNKIGITHEKLDQVHRWFEKYGKWTLTFGYFVPGVRHFTGFASGMTELDFKQFSLFAYTGALLWVTTFLSIGYFFGNFCFTCLKSMEIEIAETSIVLAVVFCLCGAYIYFRKKNKQP